MIFFFFLAITTLNAQRVLHFTKTSGFDHGTRDVSFAMFNSIAGELLIEVDDDADCSTFDELGTLMEYEVIVFANTSGDAILDPQQRTNFENWIASGGKVLAIHAASDTYRHSTANGSNTGTWDFYAELIGASVQASPNHVTGTPEYAMEHIGMHASTEALPDPWVKEEEYYYWENGYFNDQNQPVLEVEATIGPNGMVNSYDAPRPMSWYRRTPAGRVFNTALGHSADNYTSDLLFRTHVRDALEWLLEDVTAIEGNTLPQLQIISDRDRGFIEINAPSSSGDHIALFDVHGRVLWQNTASGGITRIDMSSRAAGVYVVRSERLGVMKLVW